MADQIQEDEFSSDEDFDEDENSESDTDVDAKVAEDDIFDAEFFKCYTALKKKDDKLYDKNVNFFQEEQKEVDKKQKDSLLKPSYMKMTLLDHQLNLKEDEIEEPDELRTKCLDKPVSFYEKELEEIKKSIVDEAHDSDSDDDLLVVKDKVTGLSSGVKSQRPEIKHLEDLWADTSKLTEDEKFLRDYILNKRYIPSNEVNTHFSKNLDELSDAGEEEKSSLDAKSTKITHEEEDIKIVRVPRNSTRTIRDLAEKTAKKEKRAKKLEKIRKKKKALKDQDFEDMVGDLPIKFRYVQTEPSGLSAEEILLASDDEPEQPATPQDAHHKVDEKQLAKMKKKKHKRRGLNHKKFSKVGVAPDRLLAYGLSKTKFKKSKLL